MANLTELIAGNSSIANITGLEHATNLAKLDLRSNSINNITALSGLTQLTDLWLAFNSITDISSLSNLTNLTRLTLRDNEIGDITDLGNLTNLKILWLKNCGITDVTPLQNLTNLTTLRISGNDLTNAHLLSTLTNLNNIDITIPDPPPPADTTSPDVSIAAPSDVQNSAFNATITFTEAVSDFTQSDLSLSGTATASITAWQTTDNTTYAATITPTTSGTVTLNVAANVATDAANNANTAATAQTVNVDVDKPTVTIDVPSGTQTGAFDATITFSEVVSNFVQSDLSLSGTATASITAWQTTDNTTYAATITPTTSGTVTLNVAANVATDAANNANTAATAQTVNVDVDKPTVTIDMPSGTQTGAFDATITFSEVVSNFVQSDLSLSGTATASITAWNTTDNITYTATITPTTSGTVTLNIAANVATDAANNPNTAATAQTVNVDVDRPTVTIDVPSGTQTGAFDATITFSETVSDFTQSDVSLTGSAASITAWSANSDNTVYTATITPTASGTVTVSVADNVATDAANNQNTAATAQTVTVDVDKPIVTIDVPSGTQTGAFDATITFSETVSGFAQSDVSLAGSAASITAWSANSDNTVYTATITPTASGTVTIGIAANVATDAANNPNTAATAQTVNVDVDVPSVTVSVPSGVQNGAFDATITFSESVSGFVQSDLTLTGDASASVTAWSANTENTIYTATITPTTSGTVTLNIAANVATDAANNPNTAATIQKVNVDVDKPTVTIDVPSGTQTGAFDATITFSETVSGFTQSDVALTGNAASITAWSANSDNTVYTATITPTASGTVTIGIAANVATDAANNSNTASTSQIVTVSVDTDAPSVSVSAPSGVQNSAFDATITFTEAVSDFEQSDLSLSGTATATITAWQTIDNTTYTATITPTTSGDVILGITANVATDAANNANTAAIAQTVTIDVDAPTVTIGVPSGTQTGAFDTTITFSETVSGFAQSDVSLTGAAAGITGWSANTDNAVYTATITPTASGTVTISVAGNVATDAANNPNTAATSQTVTVSIDTEAPSVSISVPSGVQNSAFDATITFTEIVSNFVQSDLSLTGTATASITAWSTTDNITYTATITPTTSGTAILGIAANVATDAANNQNTAATTQTVNVDVDKPTVTIGVPSDTQTGAFDATITFSESVSDFKQSDVNLTGDASATITAWSANTENTVYTATIIPTTSGTVTLSVDAGVATDTASNPNAAATPQTVTIAMPELVQDLTTWMPDANLRNAVRKVLKLASDETFSQEDMQSLTHLSVQNRIKDLTGLEHATQLTELNVRYSDIGDISPLAGLTSLTILDLRGNNISDVTLLAKLVNLEKLWLSENPITDISPLAELTALRWLVIMSANVSDVTPLAKLVNLEQLLLAGNSITDFSPLSNLNNLQYADVEIPEPEPLEVSISVPSDVQNGAFEATITFTEVVSNFTQEDLGVSGTASITAWSTSDDTTYAATITPTGSGQVTLSIAAGVATDAASNQNTASDSQTVTVDMDAPGVSLTAPSVVQNGAFSVTITFTETVSGFEQSELSLTGTATATITAWLTTDNITYTATITPTTSGTVILNIAANVATDAANNQNTAATSQTVNVDLDAPSVSITVPTDDQIGAFDATITFTEAVSDFEQSDVSISGTAGASITAWNTTDNITYTATITPTTSGEVTIGVAASVATDAANNANTAATTQTVTVFIFLLSEQVVVVDTDPLGVSITVPDDVQNSAFDATIMFTEVVSDFEQSDVSISGTAGASITAWNTTDNITYTATITPTTSGEVTIGVAASVATNTGGDPNTAATAQTVRVDMDSPGVSIEVPETPQNGAFEVTITFTEAVSGFEQSDVSLNGSAASITSWSANSDNTVYTATITPTTSGTVILNIAASVATDAANNPNTAATAQTVTVDVDRPIVTIGVPSGTQTGAFDATITFSETVLGFVQSDVSLTGSAASITVWSANSDNTVYTSTITPTASGTVTVSVAADVATDAANNQNTAATSQTVSVDIDAPDVSITVPSGVQNGAFSVTITFTEAVSGFEQSDVSLSGSAASITSWSANSDDTVYTATITPTASGTVTVSVAASVATDAANNPNTAATSKTVNVDVDPPGVIIAVPEDAQNGAFDVTITFTEAVSDFVQADLTLTGDANASITAWSANTENTVYTATITSTTSGEITLDVAAGVATDAVGKPNTAAPSQTVTVDVDKPSVTIDAPSDVQNGAFEATVTFTETVSGFEQEDLSLSGTTTATITAWKNTDDTIYTAEITPATSGQVILSIAAEMATDAANNPNTAATSQTVNVDVDPPGVIISVPADAQNGAFDVTITFSEAVSDFVQADLSLTGDASASITAWSANTENTIYTATITPTTSGEVILSIVADVATDAANNPNTAATSQTVNVDVDPSGVIISVPADAQNGAFDVTITFSESVSDFVQADLALTGDASASVTGWSVNTEDTIYTATITPTTSGEVILDVAANVATDAVGNPNTAATSQTVTIDVDAPTVTIEVPSGLQNGAFDVTITFTEPVSGFVESDISLRPRSSTADATVTSLNANADNTVYTATITPTTSGWLWIEVPAGVATDAANNSNGASIKYTAVYMDLDGPEVSITVPSTVQIGAFDVTITFTDPKVPGLTYSDHATISGFEQSDLQLSGTATATITAWRTNTLNTIYTATITPTSSGEVTLNIASGVATDVASHPNSAAASKTVTISEVSDVDTIQPHVNLSLDLETYHPYRDNYWEYITNDAFEVTITFSEAVSGFEQSDIRLHGHRDRVDVTITDFRVIDANTPTVVDAEIHPTFNPPSLSTDVIYATTYVVEITPSTEQYSRYEDVQVSVPQGAATDAAGNPNTSTSTRDILIDTIAPDVRLTIPNSVVETETFRVGISFGSGIHDSPVGFDSSDVSLTNNTAGATITDWSISQTNRGSFTAEVTATQSGSVTFGVLEGVATDLAGNPNTAASRKTVNVNLDQLDVSLTVPSGPQNGVFAVITTFTGAVSDFEQSDLSLTDNTADAAITTWVASSDQTTYTAVITPTTSGEVTFSVAEGVATNVANNTNSASEIQTVSVDMEAPGVSMSVPSDVQDGAFDATITFTEVVSGFEQADLGLSGTATATITAWTTTDDTIYTAKITPTTSGTVILSIAAGVATDVANNTNAAATTQTVNVDVNAPGVSISVPSDAQDSAFDVTITFTEEVSGFVQADLSLSGTATASITSWTTTDNTIYTAEITPTTSGTVILDVAAGVATDAASNPNTAATTQTVTIEMYPAWDVNKDGSVDITDLVLVANALGQSGAGIVNPRTDVNSDDTVDNADLLLVADNLDVSSAPLATGNIVDFLIDPAALETLDRDVLQAHLEILRVESDGSLKYQRAIVLLESILAAMRPDETQLLANYPNPFNPETWIPYQLANDSDVLITIYDIRGTVVRRLDLGHQQAGYHTGRSRAAHWDGTNDVGEKVASGVYFYTFTAGDFAATRKMLILK